MNMQRRRMLSLLGSVSAVTLAGCSDDGGSASSSDDGGNGNESSQPVSPPPETGNESTDQVSSSINVITRVGEVTNENEIAKLTLLVKRAPGSEEIDLTELSIRYMGDNGSANVIHGGNASDSDDAGYEVNVIKAKTLSDAVMSTNDDRYHITIKFSTGSPSGTDVTGQSMDYDNSALNTLSTGQEAEMEIVTAYGTTQNIFMTVPDEIGDTDTIKL